ncbi:conserved hypothetical protein [Altererythrobacter sp. B11]|uniref:PAS domain-containing protein n=1 Tax=Altererythrobacter sp. B11 TaxID=2060312 RepID=UPI000DC710D7|nr:hypothetical protein [Altererythrobacter sp. B11]BBC71520.1 conserved hypothetical protein [Altererythrobacter sp. B11]
MDTLRGKFDDLAGDEPDHALAEDEIVSAPPPAAIGQDERRMQVRAYNHWASLLRDRNFPAIEDLDPAALPDFAPNSVLLDFSTGVDNPGIAYLGGQLAAECGVASETLHRLQDVPGRSLLSRITDHYMQIIANQAPIGFEAEFVNQRGQTILYRGILLPYSSDDDTIDFIYGVINWKELADQQGSDELLLEIDQALEPPRGKRDPLTDWADGPAALPSEEAAPALTDGDDGLPRPTFGPDTSRVGDPTAEPPHELAVALGWDAADEPLELTPDSFADVASSAVPDEASLSDWLAAAREMASIALSCEDRTRAALYAAIGHAYDFSLAADGEAEEFAELLADAGLAMQDRAPMTPVAKLVFGADYDKTRLAEYAAALNHARRLDLPRGTLAGFLRDAEGGLKGVVKEERRLRREEQGREAKPNTRRKALESKLRRIEPTGLAAIPVEGSEFGLVMIRREQDGEVVVLGEVPEDDGLVERAARRLLG